MKKKTLEDALVYDFEAHQWRTIKNFDIHALHGEREATRIIRGCGGDCNCDPCTKSLFR